MRLLRQIMTIPIGQSVSNPIHLESDKLCGLRVIEDSDANSIRFQALVAGNAGDSASEVWADIQLTTGDFAPYTSVPFDVVSASITDGALIVFPADKVRDTPSTIRLLNHNAGVPTNITGTAFTAQLLVDSRQY